MLTEKQEKKTDGGRGFFKSFFGFKNPLLIVMIFVFLSIGMLIYFAFKISNEDLFGWRFNFGFSKVETSDYNGFAPTIFFQYPKIFEIDLDTGKKYGKGYIVGIKLKTDNRTGCDIRTGGPELDYSKSENDLADEITVPIRERVNDFNLIDKYKTKIDGKNALKISFSFLDPIGARVQLDQMFVSSEGNNFIIICGTGEYQFAFFEKDFEVFYNSINFQGNLPDKNKSSWQKLMFWKK